MPVITHIGDLQALAKRRVPRMFYDYVDSGSWTESTYRANESDLAAVRMRQRVAADMQEAMGRQADPQWHSRRR